MSAIRRTVALGPPFAKADFLLAEVPAQEQPPSTTDTRGGTS